jgi:hypothetical protein
MKPNMKSPESYDTMKQAAAGMGLNLSTLKKAKAAGCSAFRGSRVYRKELEAWLKEHKDEIVTTASKEDVQIEKLLEEVRKLRIANDLKEKELVRRSLVIEAHAKMAEQVRKLLEQKLENEYPGLVAGLDVAQARVFGKRLHDQIVSEFKGFAKAWHI